MWAQGETSWHLIQFNPLIHLVRLVVKISPSPGRSCLLNPQIAFLKAAILLDIPASLHKQEWNKYVLRSDYPTRRGRPWEVTLCRLLPVLSPALTRVTSSKAAGSDSCCLVCNLTWSASSHLWINPEWRGYKDVWELAKEKKSISRTLCKTHHVITQWYLDLQI